MDWLERFWSRWFGGGEGGHELRSLARRSGDPFRRSPYYDVAEPHMDDLWQRLIWPWIEDLDHRRVMDLAAGHGRNSVKLAAVAESLVMVDINQECLDACRVRLGDEDRFQYVRTDGYSLQGVTDDSVSLVVDKCGINTDFYIPNGEWDLDQTNALAHHHGSSLGGKTFALSVTMVEFQLRLRRRWAYCVITIICPVIMLSILNMLVFLLPCDSGEKMTLAITGLLAFTVFLSMVDDQLPETSDNISLLGE
jgi:hypothetical protein